MFRIVLRGAVRDRRRSAERGGGLVSSGHLHNRVDARVPVRMEPTVEQGAESRFSRFRLHADGRQYGENASDRWPALPGVHRGPHAMGSDCRRYGARQPLRCEYACRIVSEEAFRIEYALVQRFSTMYRENSLPCQTNLMFHCSSGLFQYL